MTEPTPDIAFTCAYWDFLRGKVALEPNAAQYGLSCEMGEVLVRQITIEWKAQQ